MADKTLPPESRTVLTRLDAIRDLLAPFDDGSQCECEQCVAGRELLAVVETTMGDWPPEAHAAQCRIEMANAVNEQDYEEWERAAEAWDGLA